MKLKFYFDFLSPYSYLAWTWLRKKVKQNPEALDFEFIPVTLAPLIHAQETKGPAEIAPKREYLMRDLLRLTKTKGIAFNPPKLPFNSLYALRLSLKECSEEKQFAIVDAFYCAAWEEGRDIGDTEVVIQVLEKLGLNGSQWIEKVSDKALRRQLKENTRGAINDGIFGLPTFLVHNEGERELFWGFDSIPYLSLYLQGEDPLDKNQLTKFQDCYTTLS